MAGPCSNCCQGRVPCLGGCANAPTGQEQVDYDLEVNIALRVTVRVRARNAAEAWDLVQRRGLRDLAREAWRRGERRLLRGGVTLPFPPGHRPRQR